MLLSAVAAVGAALIAAAIAFIPAGKFSFRIRRRLVRLRRAGRSMARRPRAMFAALSLALVAQLALLVGRFFPAGKK